jgi:hypothetical protein
MHEAQSHRRRRLGNVGQTCARVIAERNPADVVTDIGRDKAAGVALDIAQACAVIGSMFGRRRRRLLMSWSGIVASRRACRACRA